jgi:hypothetical protein
MRISTRDDSARPSVKTHYMNPKCYTAMKRQVCDTYSKLLLELRERCEMNPVHHYCRCVALQNVYLHFSCCYYGDTE